MKSTLFALAALAAAGLTVPANAAVPGLAKALGAAASKPEIEQVHYNHRSCQLGRAGWHFHRYGNRIVCRPFSRWR